MREHDSQAGPSRFKPRSSSGSGDGDVGRARYSEHLHAHIQATRDHFGQIVTSDIHEQRYYPPSAGWTERDKRVFFPSLARHSKWRPNQIATDVGKEEWEVVRYLSWLRRRDEAARLPQGGGKGGRRWEDRRKGGWVEGLAPAAREVSGETIKREDNIAQDLLRDEERAGNIARTVLGKRSRTVEVETASTVLHSTGSYLQKSHEVPSVTLTSPLLRSLGVLLRETTTKPYEASTNRPRDQLKGDLIGKIARDDERIAFLSSMPLAERSKEQMAELRVLCNRRRMRLMKRRQKLLAEGMSEEGIEELGGADAVFLARVEQSSGEKKRKKWVEERSLSSQYRKPSQPKEKTVEVKTEENAEMVGLSKHAKILRDELRHNQLNAMDPKTWTASDVTELRMLINRRRSRRKAREAKLREEGWTDEQLGAVNVDEVFAKRAGLEWTSSEFGLLHSGWLRSTTPARQRRTETSESGDGQVAGSDAQKQAERKEEIAASLANLEELRQIVTQSGLDLFNFEAVHKMVARSGAKPSLTILDHLKTYLLAYLAPLLHTAITLAEAEVDTRNNVQLEEWHVKQAIEFHPPVPFVDFNLYPNASTEPGISEPISSLESAEWLRSLSGRGNGSEEVPDQEMEIGAEGDWEIETSLTDEEDELLEEALEKVDDVYDRLAERSDITKLDKLAKNDHEEELDDPFESWRFRAAPSDALARIHSTHDSLGKEATRYRKEYLDLLVKINENRRRRHGGSMGRIQRAEKQKYLSSRIVPDSASEDEESLAEDDEELEEEEGESELESSLAEADYDTFGGRDKEDNETNDDGENIEGEDDRGFLKLIDDYDDEDVDGEGVDPSELDEKGEDGTSQSSARSFTVLSADGEI